MNNWYAQHGEDRFLVEEVFPGKTDGFFIEVGASDGISLSNSLAFERLGWKGICIEPVPESFAKLKANRSCVCLDCAVGSSYLGGHEQFAGHGVGDTLPDRTATVFYVRKDGAKDISGFTRSDNPDYYPIVVTQRTLTGICQEHNVKSIDVLSVDTEGTEVDVLKSLDISRWRPSIIIAEFSTVHYGDTSEPLSAFLKSAGYVEIKRMGGNIIAKDAGA